MPRYYFDTQDGVIAHLDQQGTIIPNREHAQSEAAKAMGEMCRDYFPRFGTSDGKLVMTVRSDEGYVLQLSVTYLAQSYE